jgi:hypothetical protein
VTALDIATVLLSPVAAAVVVDWLEAQRQKRIARAHYIGLARARVLRR